VITQRLSLTTRILILVFVLAVLVFYGCAGSVRNMREIPDEQAVYAPDPNRALIVFMRPSSFAFAVQSSVFELVEDSPELIGIVAAKKKVAYQVEPGEHLFMVIGESADFMKADIQAGKKYYVLVTPRMGMWKARFSLKPIHKDELDSDELVKWEKECHWVEKTYDSDQWAKSNMDSIQSKNSEYMQKWLQRPEPDRPALHIEDGL
jgi:hypothetical protein